jgi:hypothetical protein
MKHACLVVMALLTLLAPPAPAQTDTLAVEQAAIAGLLSRHAGGRVIALDPRFAFGGHAPPPMTTQERPSPRQDSLRSVIAAQYPSTRNDTLHLLVSKPVFIGEVATLSVTVSYVRSPGPRGKFYETMEFDLVKEAGRWVISRRRSLGIS